jgi:hypothetical protein
MRGSSVQTPATVFFWRRVDTPGCDHCRFFQSPQGCRLLGAAVFVEARLACHLQYEVVADAAFRTRSASIKGHIGKEPIDLRLRAGRGGRWQLNGVDQPAIRGCLDVDLGFTPATNLLPLRRLALRTGQEALAPAAYLPLPKTDLVVLPQRYRRLSRSEYDYESPDHGYRATLRVTRLGAVADYPGLFEMLPFR